MNGPIAGPGRIRVLHLLKTSTWALWGLRQVEQLCARGAEVHVALPPGGRLVAGYEAAGAVVHPIQLDIASARPWQVPALLARFRTLVAEVRPDLIHSHFVGTTLTARLALGRRHPVPRVFQVPGPLHLEHVLSRTVELAAAGPSDWWIGGCRWTADRYVRSGIDAGRVFVSHYGTDVDRHARRPGGALRAELGLDAAQPLVGMLAFVYAPKRALGQTRGIKGHEDLIDALALCRRHEPRLRAVFIGGAWPGGERYERRIRAHAAARCGDAAVFLGTRSDVPDLLPDLDVLAVPSLSENVGAALEGLLAEVPTVATRVGGLPDLVEEPGTGWLVPPGDPERLSAALLEALRDPLEARARAARGRRKAVELLDVRRTAADVLRIYRRILDAGPTATAG